MQLSPELHDFLMEKFDSRITDHSPIGGGCINEAFRARMENGQSLFIKQNRRSLLDMFEKEAKGLKLLAGATEELHIPEVHGFVEDETEDKAYLILSFVEEKRPTGEFDDHFGRSLARLHQNTTSQFGLDHDNYIGRLPQKNDSRPDWISFFISCRIEPQFAMAIDNGHFSRPVQQSLDRLFRKLPEIFSDEPASLLHGDLWGGNYLCDRENRPVLIDPAVYYGNREAELSFTRLFGGFGRDFYKGYQEVWPLEEGFRERIDIYNLYPLLVHVNLFGGAYVTQTESIIRRF